MTQMRQDKPRQCYMRTFVKSSMLSLWNVDPLTYSHGVVTLVKSIGGMKNISPFLFYNIILFSTIPGFACYGIFSQLVKYKMQSCGPDFQHTAGLVSHNLMKAFASLSAQTVSDHSQRLTNTLTRNCTPQGQ
jgi:hypothetical protein